MDGLNFIPIQAFVIASVNPAEYYPKIRKGVFFAKKQIVY